MFHRVVDYINNNVYFKIGRKKDLKSSQHIEMMFVNEFVNAPNGFT